MWFVGGSPAIFKRDGQEVYRTKHLVKGLYYNDSSLSSIEFTNESRNVAIVKERLYFLTDVEDHLVEYDLALLDEFIKEKMDYHPRKLTDKAISDFHVQDSKNIWILSTDGDLSKLKSFHRNQN